MQADRLATDLYERVGHAILRTSRRSEFKKTDVTINSKLHVIHGAVYYLVTSSREPMGRKLASFDRNEISAGQEFTWTANTAIIEFLLLGNLFSSLGK